MRNLKIVFLTLTLLFFVSVFTPADVFSQEKPGITVTTNKRSYNPGESGVMTIKFNTKKGVKIPKEPPISVNITGGGISGSLQDYSAGSSEYISNSTIRYSFKVPENATSGSLKITGTVNFGYCNESDGICKLGKSNFSRTITVK